MSETTEGFRVTKTGVIYLVAVTIALVLAFLGEHRDDGIFVLGGHIPFAFVLFVLVLMGVAFFHHHTMWVALGGLVVVTAYTGLFAHGFHWSKEQHTPGLWGHFLH